MLAMLTISNSHHIHGLFEALPSSHQSTGRCKEVQPQSLAVSCSLMLAGLAACVFHHGIIWPSESLRDRFLLAMPLVS
jgi:hypothetical protein